MIGSSPRAGVLGRDAASFASGCSGAVAAVSHRPRFSEGCAAARRAASLGPSRRSAGTALSRDHTGGKGSMPPCATTRDHRRYDRVRCRGRAVAHGGDGLGQQRAEPVLLGLQDRPLLGARLAPSGSALRANRDQGADTRPASPWPVPAQGSASLADVTLTQARYRTVGPRCVSARPRVRLDAPRPVSRSEWGRAGRPCRGGANVRPERAAVVR